MDYFKYINLYNWYNNISEWVIYITPSKKQFKKEELDETVGKLQNIRDNKVINAFSKILINTDPYTLLVRGLVEYVSKDLVLRSPINLSKLDIKLLDYLGNTIDLGKNDFSLTLELGYVYDKKLYEEIHNKGIPNGDTRTKFFY